MTNPKSMKGYAFEISEPAAERILATAKAGEKIRVQSVLKKDSRDITDADRQLLADACNAAPENRIAITHGTDTLLQTAAYLATRVHGKTIVLTGAFLPEKFVTAMPPSTRAWRWPRLKACRPERMLP